VPSVRNSGRGAMKKPFVALSAVMVVSLACQVLTPKTGREGTIVKDCSSIVQGMIDIQSVEVPKNLMETGVKTGGEFDANNYFKVLTHLSMQAGYSLDYVYSVDFLGSLPLLYARPVDQPAYASMADLPEGMKLGDYKEHLMIEDIEQGYFEYVVMDMLAGQFYLVWHANYGDTEIVCDRDAAQVIVETINSGDFGYKLDLKQQAQVRAMTNIEPAVRLTDEGAIVEVITFTKWGGFFRRTYTISRSFPHTVEMNEENLVEYNCGIMF
jgi:hypothetical protein